MRRRQQSRAWHLGARRGSDAAVKLLQVAVHGQAPLALALEAIYYPVTAAAEAAPALAELADALRGALQSGGGGSGGGGADGGSGGSGGGAAVGTLDALPPPWEEFGPWLPPEAGAPLQSAALYVSLVGAVLRERASAAAAANAGGAAAAAAAAQRRRAAAAPVPAAGGGQQQQQQFAATG